ncbi:MAG: HAD-IA family hydrolase [Dehalococcoidia bacterium]
MTSNRDGRPFDVVVFDLGGVLVRIARDWTEAHAFAGFEPHPITTDPVFDAERHRLSVAHQAGTLDSESYYRLKADLSGGVYTTEDVRRIIEGWSREEYEGVGSVIDALDAAGVTTAALSNTNPAHWARLDGTEEYPTVARLRYRHASHLLGSLKPEAAIYRTFEAATGFEAARILFFDDSLPNVEAARTLGWAAEHVDHRGDTAAQLLAHLTAHHVISDITGAAKR